MTTDREQVTRWSAYARQHEREIARTINVANRIFGVPREQWAKR
jgi:hypothetical protein